MHPENIVIVGPTSSGKTDLSLFIASFLQIPIINCDSVQVYRDLDVLSNKPRIAGEEIIKGEVVSYVEGKSLFDYPRYSRFSFHIIRRTKGIITTNRVLGALDFFKWLIHTRLAPDTFSESGLVKHYLFNIRNPQEAYSTADFIADVDRIEAKESLSQKIITGGTIYYAYHYLLGTSFELQQEKIEVVSARSPEEMRAFLQEKDPEALSIIDANNPARLLKAVQSIETNGKKYSETYFKEMNPKEDFLLIAIVPNDREEYRDYLGEVIKKRMNQDALDEVRQLVSAHGDSVRTWLDILSYEYRFAGKIADLFDADENIDFDSPEVREMIDILLVKERQYTKRQMTFIRKLLSDLSKLPNKD